MTIPPPTPPPAPGPSGTRRHPRVLRSLAMLAGLALCLPQTPTRSAAAESTPDPANRPANRPFRFAAVDDHSLGLWEGDQPVLVYRHGVIRRDDRPADRARSTYVHPLYGLDGEVLTDDFPDDHHHHRGLFWAWPHVTIAGRNHDLWALSGIEQRFERWLARDTGPGGALLGVENGWYAGNRRVMGERLWFTILPRTDNARAVDLDATWTPGPDPVTLAGAEGKSYGGLTLRFAPRRNTVITTPLGSDTNDLYITRLPWTDLSGSFAESANPSGVALFVAPDHPGYPPTWLTRHYGVLCLGWPGVEPQTFQPAEPIRARYRAWVHRGRPDPQQLAAAYGAYTQAIASATSASSHPTPPTQGTHAIAESDRVRILVDGHPFTEYRFPSEAKLPSFFPVLGPRSKQSVTTEQADPYPHHASLWFGCDRVNGGNYWQERPDRGRIRHLGLRIVDDGRITGTVIFEHESLWERPGAEPPFRDHRTIRIHAPSTDRRLIDFEITLTALTEVRIETSNHSLFAARLAPDLAVTGGGRLANAHGDLGEQATFGRTAGWMDARGPRPGGIVEGITVFPSRSNPDQPVPWFTRDYGFLSPTRMYWLQGGERRFARGETFRLRYRVLVHADDPSPDELAMLALNW